jgi:hypothetical protein
MGVTKALEIDVVVHLAQSNQGMKHFRVLQRKVEPNRISTRFDSEGGTKSGSQISKDCVRSNMVSICT